MGGIFDGEGTAGVYLYPKRSPIFMLSISQNDKVFIDWLHSFLGGGGCVSRRGKNWFVMWQSRSEVVRVAALLAPFTILKTPQLRIMARLQGMTLPELKAAAGELKKLKKIGLAIRPTRGRMGS